MNAEETRNVTIYEQGKRAGEQRIRDEIRRYARGRIDDFTFEPEYDYDKGFRDAMEEIINKIYEL